jgi:oligopeptide/dipeptide ABC transporter ATP-binding protein
VRPLIEVENLEVRFRQSTLADILRGRRRTVRAVSNVSLAVPRGATLGLVGESGCGKSTLARAVLRLIEPTAGVIRFDGTDVRALSGGALLRYRRSAQMVFQDPYAALNPRLTVAEALAEVFHVHRLCDSGEIRRRVESLMATVGLSPELADRRPGALSGGQSQRVVIARALAVGPELVIADEAVSALDVSIQAQILNLLAKLREQMHLTLIFISHDLGVVRHLCQQVAVMYLGRIVEQGPTAEVFARPRHPYTQALIAAIPTIDPSAGMTHVRLAGEPPSPARVPAGCAFHPRCPRAMPICREGDPPPRYSVENTRVWCHLYAPEGAA